jgi:hypothetical protein
MVRGMGGGPGRDRPGSRARSTSHLAAVGQAGKYRGGGEGRRDQQAKEPGPEGLHRANRMARSAPGGNASRLGAGGTVSAASATTCTVEYL